MSRSNKFNEIDKYMRQRYSRLAEEEFNSFTARKEVLWKGVEDRFETCENILDTSPVETRGPKLWLWKFWPDALTTAAAVFIMLSTIAYTPGEPRLADTMRPGLSRMLADENPIAQDRGLQEANNSFLNTKL